MGLALSRPDHWLQPDQRVGGQSDGAPRRRGATGLAGGWVGRQPGHVGLLQVLRVLQRVPGADVVALRFGAARAGQIGGAAGGDQLLYVPGDQLHRRCVQGRRAHLFGTRRQLVSGVLSAAGGGPDRSYQRVHAGVAPSTKPRWYRCGPGGSADRPWTDQEGGHRLLHGRTGRSGVCCAWRIHGLYRFCGHPCLRHPDLRRLLGLHRHRHRHRFAVGVSLSRQLRSSVCGEQHSGLLASLAHDVVALAARLPLHPTRRKPGWSCPPLPQPDPDDGPGRALARGQRHLPGVGALPGRWFGGGTLDERPAQGRRSGFGRHPLGLVGATSCGQVAGLPQLQPHCHGRRGPEHRGRRRAGRRRLRTLSSQLRDSRHVAGPPSGGRPSRRRPLRAGPLRRRTRR